MGATIMGILFGGIITILVSLFFYLLQKRSKYPGEVIIAVTDFQRIVQKYHNTPNKLSLKYEDYEVNNNLVYFELIITNVRPYDIRNDDSVSSLSLCLTNGSKWIDVRVKSCSDGVSPVVSLKGGPQLNICWDLLRKGEYLLLAGLVETSSIYSDKKLLRDISVNHRIPNLAPVNKVLVGDNDYYKKMIRVCWLYFAMMSMVLLACLLIPQRLSSIKYLDKESDNNVELFVDQRDSLVLYHSFFRKERISPLEIGRRFIPVYEHTNSPSYIICLALFFIFLNCVILAWCYIKRSINNNIFRLLKS